MSLLEPIAGGLSKSVVNYLRLWRLVNRRLTHYLSSRATHELSTCREFYDGIASGRIKHGDRVVLRGFFATDWIPREPGGWAAVARESKQGSEEYGILPQQCGCFTSTERGWPWGIAVSGSLRLPLLTQEYQPLGVVSTGEYHTDLGLTTLVSRAVYSEYLSCQIGFDSVETDIDGFVSLAGPEGFENESGWRVKEPVIVVDSPIQARFRSNKGHPKINIGVVRIIEYKSPPPRAVRFGDDLGVDFGQKTEAEFVCASCSSSNPEELVSSQLIAQEIVPGLGFRSSSRALSANELLNALRVITGTIEVSTVANLKDVRVESFSRTPPAMVLELEEGLRAVRRGEHDKETATHDMTLNSFWVENIEIVTECDGRKGVLRPVLSIQDSLQVGAESLEKSLRVIGRLREIEGASPP